LKAYEEEQKIQAAEALINEEFKKDPIIVKMKPKLRNEF